MCGRIRRRKSCQKWLGKIPFICAHGLNPKIVCGMAEKKGRATFYLPARPSFPYAVILMPRIPRGQLTGHAYHVLNRGNGGTTVFHKDRTYAAFLDLFATAKTNSPLKLFGFCLMPNHFHLVVHPATTDALSPFIQVGDNPPRPPLPSPLSKSWACVARPLQQSSDSPGRGQDRGPVAPQRKDAALWLPSSGQRERNHDSKA